jgi:hypothetical protein
LRETLLPVALAVCLGIEIRKIGIRIREAPRRSGLREKRENGPASNNGRSHRAQISPNGDARSDDANPSESAHDDRQRADRYSPV